LKFLTKEDGGKHEEGGGGKNRGRMNPYREGGKKKDSQGRKFIAWGEANARKGLQGEIHAASRGGGFSITKRTGRKGVCVVRGKVTCFFVNRRGPFRGVHQEGSYGWAEWTNVPLRRGK